MLLGLEGKHDEAMESIERACNQAKPLGQPRVLAAVERSAGELSAGQARLVEDDVGKANHRYGRGVLA